MRLGKGEKAQAPSAKSEIGSRICSRSISGTPYRKPEWVPEQVETKEAKTRKTAKILTEPGGNRTHDPRIKSRESS
jgi:hypothetical protein